LMFPVFTGGLRGFCGTRRNLRGADCVAAL
jgi:hypothetical protein